MVFTEKHELVRALAKKFASEQLEPIADEIDKTSKFPAEVVAKMAKAGFFGIKMPKKYGGSGADNRSYAIVMEEISRKSAVAGVYVSAPNSLVGAPIYISGSEEQKDKYLPMIIDGSKMFCFALTEPGAGSDSASLQTTAVPDGDYYILNGRKAFITAAPISDYAIVFAKTDMSKGAKGITTFIVDMKLPGVSTGKDEEKMGIVGCPTSDLVLENVRVHKSEILGSINEGFTTAMKTLSIGRVGIAAQSVGIAQAAMDEALK